MILYFNVQFSFRLSLLFVFSFSFAFHLMIICHLRFAFSQRPGHRPQAKFSFFFAVQEPTPRNKKKRKLKKAGKCRSRCHAFVFNSFNAPLCLPFWEIRMQNPTALFSFSTHTFCAVKWFFFCFPSLFIMIIVPPWLFFLLFFFSVSALAYFFYFYFFFFFLIVFSWCS